MRRVVPVLAALGLAFAVAPAAHAASSTSWNNSPDVRFDATLLGVPPTGIPLGRRVSTSEADKTSNARPGDADQWAIDAADAQFGLTSLFPSGATGLHSTGTTATHVSDPTNPNGPTYDSTVVAYVKSGPLHGQYCSFTYRIEPVVFDGSPTVSRTLLGRSGCPTNY